ncbi:DUF2934 domain-containing protein [Bradyrhizobium sp. th.b2]|uniref:DUF2934 domain-containing protein n=1 Tax=Bradyrhizobium sp. th-b2 TaxID=172088 RepID=UPI0009FF6398|nr:DUF2934 domain-containing protein [Bradyrhizobium sp. th.b2]
MPGPTEEEIRPRAYQLWQEAGEPEDQADTFWHQAENELLRRDSELGEPPPSLTDNLPV